MLSFILRHYAVMSRNPLNVAKFGQIGYSTNLKEPYNHIIMHMKYCNILTKKKLSTILQNKSNFHGIQIVRVAYIHHLCLDNGSTSVSIKCSHLLTGMKSCKYEPLGASNLPAQHFYRRKQNSKGVSISLPTFLQQKANSVFFNFNLFEPTRASLIGKTNFPQPQWEITGLIPSIML